MSEIGLSAKRMSAQNGGRRSPIALANFQTTRLETRSAITPGEKCVVWSLFAGRSTSVISPIFIGGGFLRATDGTRVAVDLAQQRNRFRRRHRRGRPWRHRSLPKENESWRCEC